MAEDRAEAPVQATPMVDVRSAAFRGRLTDAAVGCMKQVFLRPQEAAGGTVVPAGPAILDTIGFTESGRSVVDITQNPDSASAARRTFIGDAPEHMAEIGFLHTATVGPEETSLGFTEKDGKPDALHFLVFDLSKNQYVRVTSRPLPEGATVDPTRWPEHQGYVLDPEYLRDNPGSSELVSGFIPEETELSQAFSKHGLGPAPEAPADFLDGKLP